ncbi:MAG: hypothetical protein A3H96_25820 [Acidobacteria bacterium RIFCSPLOWO2_02_FULL_67_36]|nr:MAG: hypothetical protein A3H96_25820 [Acidobacteria bacterium RIFCSPLOWO2_02_FULL_67_36]
MRRSVVAFSCATFLYVPVCAAQGAAADDLLRRYRALVDAYAEHDKSAVRELLQWNDKQIVTVLTRLDTPGDPLRPWSARRYKAAIMLHTDAALQLFDANEETMQHQLDAAVALAARAQQNDAGDVGEFASRWSIAVSRLLRDRLRPRTAERFLGEIRKALPDDAGVLFESGTLAEELATAYAFEIDLAMTDAMRRRTVETIVERVLQRRKERLETAARWLEEALAVQATESARLHLGRVRMLLGEDAEALRVFGNLESSEDPGVAYLAPLFTAAVHERQGHLDEAAAAYGRAHARYPRGHSAVIGLSAVQQRTGKGDASRESLQSLLAQPAEPDDPWWWYQYDPAGAADQRVDAIRQEARR